MSESAERILLGKIVGVFGIKGWLKVHSYTDPKENIFSYETLLLKEKSGWQTIKLQDGKVHGKGLVVKLKEIDDRTKAETYLGSEIYVNREQMEVLSADEYYWHDLIDCEVINAQDIRLGKVKRLMETGANDVLVLKPNDRLLPYIWQQVIKSVDVKEKVIRVDWLEEYFD